METGYKKRINILPFILKCWNSIDNSVMVNIYNHVYKDINFCNRCVQM